MKLKAALAAGALAAGYLTAVSVVTAPPASASWVCETLHFCGDVKHKSPDNGYDDPIKVTCDYGDKSPVQYVAEGQASTCHDVDGIYVYSGTEVTCVYLNSGDATLKFDATGWHKINDRTDLSCVNGLD